MLGKQSLHILSSHLALVYRQERGKTQVRPRNDVGRTLAGIRDKHGWVLNHGSFLIFCLWGDAGWCRGGMVMGNDLSGISYVESLSVSR